MVTSGNFCKNRMVRVENTTRLDTDFFFQLKITLCNVVFQRIERRDKKAFLSEQHQEIGGKNRMGNIRALFNKIRNTKGTFHAKMGTIKETVWI